MWYISGQHWLRFTTSYGPTLDFMADICDSGSVQLLGSSGRAGRVQRQRRKNDTILPFSPPPCLLCSYSVHYMAPPPFFFFLVELNVEEPAAAVLKSHTATVHVRRAITGSINCRIIPVAVAHLVMYFSCA